MLNWAILQREKSMFKDVFRVGNQYAFYIASVLAYAQAEHISKLID